MIPAQFEYVAPSSVEEALAALAEGGEDAKVMAGGQSLLPILRMRLNVPSVLATPVWITADTVKDVVAAGQANAADICKGIEKLCTKYGVS